MTVGGRVLQRALQHLRALERHVGLAETHAAGFGELGHLGQHLALQIARERAQREQACLMELLRAELQHLHQARLVEHRIGIGRTHQAGHTTCHRSAHFGLQHALVLIAGLAQSRGQIDQTRQHVAALGVDHTGWREVLGLAINRDDAARRQRDVADLVQAAGWIDHAAVLNK
ncbi:hypothetical protein SDC9_194193 [bioreactor metagenome]|uniref:Uncharacterized protein n=1 Tax=bioreactor metagenome TaxID=1076179 RepID=A0A645I741_9ZZZZ